MQRYEIQNINFAFAKQNDMTYLDVMRFQVKESFVKFISSNILSHAMLRSVLF